MTKSTAAVIGTVATRPTASATNVERMSAEELQLRAFADRALEAGVSRDVLVDLIADEIYQMAMGRGGFECDLGVYGPRLFRREARAFVTRVLDG